MNCGLRTLVAQPAHGLSGDQPFRGINGAMRAILGFGIMASLAFGCQMQDSKTSTPAGATRCEAEKQQLIGLLKRLPEQALSTNVHVKLPQAALPGTLGSGVLLSVSERRLVLNDEPIPGDSPDARIEAMAKALAELFSETSSASKGAASEPDRAAVYVAAEATLNVRTLHSYLRRVPKHVRLQLLFAAPQLELHTDRERPAFDLAEALLNEPDATKRGKLAQQGYESFAECSQVASAGVRANRATATERWPVLRSGMLEAVQECPCHAMHAPSLGHVLVAEQRAGSLALGSLPLDFMRDVRCSASMPLRSMQKLLRQVEDFDAEFSGGWHNDELSFEKVLENERLLNYFCDALPGETLAALQRAQRTLYFRLQGSSGCQAWTFEPLSPGAPMGNLVRNPVSSAAPSLTLHYWQGAEEIRVFGPGGQGSKATDERKFPCDQNLTMLAVDADKISFEKGQWFLEKAACEAADDSAALAGCVAALATGTANATEMSRGLAVEEPADGAAGAP